MAKQTPNQLKDGLKVGEETHRDFVLRKPTAGDLFDATEAAEKLVPTPDGPALVVSNARLGVEVLRRQIVSIGPVQGPISLTELRLLSQDDLAILQDAANAFDVAVAKDLEARGRPAAPGRGAGAS